jgi:hypothetical protein
MKRDEVKVSKNHIHLLIIEDLNGKILVDITDSKLFQGKIIKPLSLKNEVELDLNKAHKAFGEKYQFKGVLSDRISKKIDFEIDEKTFHVFHLFRRKETITINGNFHKIDKAEITKNGWLINIKGIRDKCSITDSLKMALLA